MPNPTPTPTPDISIRSFKPDDLGSVLRIAQAAWEPIYAGYQKKLGDELYNLMYPDWKKKKRGQIEFGCTETGSQTYVVVVHGAVVGFLTYHLDRKKLMAEFINNAVDPVYQGLGIGTKLYVFVLERLKTDGIKYITVTTGGDDAHTAARRAYEKVGFEVKLSNVTYVRKL